MNTIFRTPLAIGLSTALMALAACQTTNPKQENTVSNQELFEHARQGNLIKLGQVVGGGADVNVTDADGMTALMHAAANNNYAEAGLLVGKDANLDARDNSGKSALMYASAAGSHKVVKLLLKKGADSSLADKDGKTAADHAGEDPKVLKLLRDLG